MELRLLLRLKKVLLSSLMFLIAFVSVYAQTNSQEGPGKKFTNVIDINADWGKNKNLTTIEIDSEIETERIVFLETSKNCLIGNIEKVLFDSKICYILHSYGSTKELLLFSCETGKFICKIGNLGKGPGEYIRIDDFDVLGDNIYLLDSSSGKVLTFNNTGQFADEIKCNLFARSLIALNSDLFLLYLVPMYFNENNNFALVWINSSGKIVKRAVPMNKDEPQIPRPYVFSRCSDRVIFAHSLSDTLFQVMDLDVTPFCRVNFGNKISPLSKVKKREAGDVSINHHWIKDLEDLNAPFFLHNYFFEYPYFVVSYFYDTKVYTLFASVDSQKLLEGYKYKSDHPKGFYTIRPKAIFGSSVMYIESAMYFRTKLIEDKGKYQKQLPDFAKEFDYKEILNNKEFELRNPILIFSRLKF